ncbi:reverse transcriptase domain-containing protein [Tanacetum coccineum]
MSTRSTSSNLFSPLRDPESLIRRRNLGEPSSLFDFEEVMSIPHNNQGPPPAGPPPPNNNGPPPVVRPNGPAPRSMEELCQPSIDGRGGPIAPIPIQATDFGLRHHMIQQVQNTCQFHGLPGDDANRHIDKFLEITQHMKQNGVSDDALHLSLFPYSLTHHAITWYDRLPRNSIHSFDDMMRKFLLKYFPPSMVTKLRNEITKFEQKPHQSLFEAREHYKLSIDRCPKHNMLLVTQIDTFYNGLTLSHRDTINAAAGGTFMQKTPEECYKLIENMTAHHNHWDTSTTRDETSRNISSTTTIESPEVVRQLEMMNKNFSTGAREQAPPEFSLMTPSPRCRMIGAIEREEQQIVCAGECSGELGGGDAGLMTAGDELNGHSSQCCTCVTVMDNMYLVSTQSERGDLDKWLGQGRVYGRWSRRVWYFRRNRSLFLTNDQFLLGIDDADFDPEGDLLLLEKLLNNDPSSPLHLKELHFEEIKMIKSSIDDPPELELKDLPSHLEYAFLEGTDKLPVVTPPFLHIAAEANLGITSRVQLSKS